MRTPQLLSHHLQFFLLLVIIVRLTSKLSDVPISLFKIISCNETILRGFEPWILELTTPGLNCPKLESRFSIFRAMMFDDVVDKETYQQPDINEEPGQEKIQESLNMSNKESEILDSTTLENDARPSLSA